jgi:hypothetical protein
MPRPYAAVLVGVFCASVVGSSAGLAQDLGGQRRRPIERGPVDVAQLTDGADLIVRGSVTSKQARWIGRVIYTQYDVTVQETLKGAPRNRVLVAVIGGTIGNVALSVPGAPEFALGRELVFFGVPLDNGATFTPIATFDGILPITADNRRPTLTVSPRGIPEDLEAFLRQVRTLSRRP